MFVSLRNLAIGLYITLSQAAVMTAGDYFLWTRTATSRLLRDASPTGRTAVDLAAAGNEWESFQILMRSSRPLTVTAVEMGDLSLIAPEGKTGTISGSTARVYRQHQFEITVPTHRNERFQPGWYPDALIPAVHPLTGEALPEARFAALPFALPAEETHGFLVDLYVPEDATPGDYRGACRVVTKELGEREILVTLRVWGFSLPPTPTMATALGSPASRMRGYYQKRKSANKEEPPEDWEAVDAQCAELLSRHRVNATPPTEMLTPVKQPEGSYRVPDERIDALRDFIDRHRVNALQTPHPRSVVQDPIAEKETLHAWLEAFDSAAERLDRPEVVFFTYLLDEPNDEEAYRYVQKWGQAIKEADSALKVLVVEQTWPQNENWGDLYGAVDIWCPLFSLCKPESLERRLAEGETAWTYTALCQLDPTPWWHTDYPLLNYRVPAWTSWKYGITGILYWGGMVYWNDVDDVWTEPGTLDRRDRREDLMYNGEGSLLYPGRAVGYDGVAPSLRLKALRDGIEDYEYMAILDRLGERETAAGHVMPLVESWFQWNPDPAAYESARRELAKEIESAVMP